MSSSTRSAGLASALLVLAVGAPAAGAASRPQTQNAASVSRAAKPFFDSRTASREAAEKGATANGFARSASATVSARASLKRELGPQAFLALDPITDTPRQLVRTDGALSAPASGARADIALGYVRSHLGALGLAGADVATLKQTKATTTNGLTVLKYAQVAGGIPAWDNGLTVGVDAAGRVVSLAGSPLRGLTAPTTAPALDGVAALAKLQEDVGVVRTPAIVRGPEGAQKTTTFARGDFARLVQFGTASGAKLGWHVLYRASSKALYDAVVDASSGAILYRQNLVKDAAADASIYPLHPGATTPFTRNLVTDSGLKPNALTLDGRYARAWSDVDDDDEVGAGEDVTRADTTGDFVHPFQAFDAGPDCTAAYLCAWDPEQRESWQVNREQNATQAFWLVSNYAKHLARPVIGFDDASGSFEVGGTGGDDPVLVQADDGAATAEDGGPDPDHVDNANMATPPDGLSPTMQMYLFTPVPDPAEPDATAPFRAINGGDDARILYHEYTHGLSNRLVTSGDGSGALSSPQSGAMGEAWSDFYALDKIVRDGLRTDTDEEGELDEGEYGDLPGAHALRFSPVDCPVGAVDRDCPGGLGTAVGGFTYGDFGRIYTGPEVHADGEIWAQTLWDLRQAMIAKFGDAATGSSITELLVTDAMRLSPPEPTFLDMRNAILAAAVNASSGPDPVVTIDLSNAVWSVFRRRGMGYYAAAADGSDVAPIEDFVGPPNAAGAKGIVRGTVTDAATGKGVPGIKVAFGGHATELKAGTGEFLGGVTAADGSYEITGVPVGTYPKLVFAGAGYDVDVARNVEVSQTPKVVDAVAGRDWAALSGGATVATNDNTGSDFGCGVNAALDQSLGTAWSAENPVGGKDTDGQLPTATITLPQAIDVTTFQVDPSGGCGDDPSATTASMKIETSPSESGEDFTVAASPTFTEDDIAGLTDVAPAAGAGAVRRVRITLLTALDTTLGNAGRSFIDLSEFKIAGGTPNVLPTGTLSTSTATPAPNQEVTFTAAFSDPDSAITGYDWDFDGNGTVDRSTPAPTTEYAYAAAGTVTPRVAAQDFRGGSGTAAAPPLTVTNPPAPAPVPGPQGPAGPAGTPGTGGSSAPTRVTVGSRGRFVLTLPATGTRSASLKVRCTTRCTFVASATVTAATAKRLKLTRRTLASVRRSVTGTATQTVALRVPATVLRAARRAGVKTLSVRVSASAGTVRATRTVRVRL